MSGFHALEIPRIIRDRQDRGARGEQDGNLRRLTSATQLWKRDSHAMSANIVPRRTLARCSGIWVTENRIHSAVGESAATHTRSPRRTSMPPSHSHDTSTLISLS